jgi:hypothetical protein
MKLAAHDNSMETNTETVSQNFGIGNLAVLIGLLRKNVYQHRIRTLVQEYMSNGRDSQREAKTSKRMVVSIPNELSPVFKVRDFGVGITPQRMSGVFLQYGNSTKRKSNKETGGFGIGGKSAFAYTDSFTVISITNGVKRTYVAHLGSANEGSMDLLSEVETTEESGVEIQVAIKPNDSREFRQSVFRAMYFWADTERPELRGLSSLTDQIVHKPGLMIGKELEINANPIPDFIQMDYHAKCLLVIDGIPYPVGEDLIEKIPNMESLLERLVSKAIIHIGNGVIEVAMSREQIADSPFTLEAMGDLAKTMENSLKSHITTIFKQAKTNAEWIKAFKELSKFANVDDYSKFGDYSIERNSIQSTKFADIECTHVSLRTKRRAKNASLERETGRFITLDNVDHVFVCDLTEPVVTQNKRMREYMERTNRMSMMLINATEKKIADPKWVRPAQVSGQPLVMAPMIVSLTFKDSKKVLAKITADFNAKNLSTLPYTPTVRIPKAKRDRTKEMFTMHESTGSGKSPKTTTIETVQATSDMYYYIPFKQYDKFENELNDLFHYMDKQKITLCAMTEDSISMVQGCKQFKSYTEWKTNFKPDAKTLARMKGSKAKNCKHVNLLKRSKEAIKDKHVALMLQEYKNNVIESDIVPKTILDWCKDDLAHFVAEDEKLTKLLKEVYPLVGALENAYNVTTEHVDELIVYINAKSKGR